MIPATALQPSPTSLDTTGNKSSANPEAEWRSRVASRLEQLGYKRDKVIAFLACRNQVRTLLCINCGNQEERPISCDLRVCPLCARTRSNLLYHRLLPTLLAANGHGYRLKLVTVTLKVHSIEADLARIGKAIPLFVKRALKAPGFGVVAGLEVGENRNVHAHMVFLGPFVPVQRLQRCWEEITGDSRVVD